MLAIDLDGVKALLSLLQEVNDGHIPDEPTLEAVLAANAFFVNFYSGWDECDREILQQAILHFHQPEQAPAGTLPGRLAEGFRQAVEERDLMWSRIDWLREVDASSIADRVLAFLPEPAGNFRRRAGTDKPQQGFCDDRRCKGIGCSDQQGCNGVGQYVAEKNFGRISVQRGSGHGRVPGRLQ